MGTKGGKAHETQIFTPTLNKLNFFLKERKGGNAPIVHRKVKTEKD